MKRAKKIPIYTRKGDNGMTALFGGGIVSKCEPRVAAYGCVDEVNSVIGWVRAVLASDNRRQSRLDEILVRLQYELLEVGTDLATPLADREVKRSVRRIGQAETRQLEQWIDELDAELPPLREFILPGGSEAAARLHIARTVCRRTERAVVAAKEHSVALNSGILVYLNRLSDLLFIMARCANAAG